MRRRHSTPLSLLLACLAAAALGGPAPASGDAGNRLFADGFERGFSAWKLQARPERVGVIAGRRGRRAARFEVRAGEREPRTGSERAEVYLDNPTFRAGTTVVVRDSIRLGRDFVASEHFRSWRIVQQLHEVGIIGPPGLAVFVDPGPRFGLRSGTSRPRFWRSQTLQRGRWYRLTYAAHLSSDPRKGWVRVWLDGRPQPLLNGALVQYGTTLRAARAFLKVGLYRSPFFSDTSVVDHDAVSVTAAP